MTTTDTDIDLDLDDREPELVYETTGWSRVVHVSSVVAGMAAMVAVPADLLDLPRLLAAAVAGFVLAVVLAGFALVMEYRADHRTPEVGGHGA